MRRIASTLLGAALALSSASAAAQAAPAYDPGLAGFNDGFYIRDSRDRFRFHPTAFLHTDVYGSFGPGVPDDPNGAPKKTAHAPDVASGLATRLVIRRARVGVAGELLGRWSFAAGVEFGGQALGNPAGTAETTAARPGQAPTATSGRYAPLQSVTAAATPLDVFINYRVASFLNIMIGHMQIPFSIENQTADAYGTWMERSMPMRSFVAPGPRDLGGTLWGEIGQHVLRYTVGVFGGDGQNRPSVDARVDFMGRVYVRPFASGATSDLARYFQLGVSARHGDRDAEQVGYDYTPITTSQGFVLWKPTYTDSQKRLVHIIPSGAQNAISGELRLRSGRFALQGEAAYVVNNTREAVDGYQLTNTERLGRMKGVGWYAQVTAWPVGDAFIAPEPGVYRPRHVDLHKPPSAPHGLEMMAIAAGVNAEYDGASRLGSKPDANTPSGKITIYQVGVGATYWHTRHARLTVNYLAYLTPGSGSAGNRAVVPDNLRLLDDGKPSQGHVLHELSARVALGF